jgi:hypothetical protein
MKDKGEELPRARVFIGCGQRNEKEKQIGLACKQYFDERHFISYFAEEVHSLEALTENIFRHLRNSEYSVFIDFRREEVDDGKFRGSVFVNQEIAIASFLQIDSRVFHEKGVIREGVVEHLIANPIYFSGKQDLLVHLEESTKEWRSDWRKDLSVKFLRVVPNVRDQYGNFADWYHLHVSNNHQNEHARNCAAYVSKIKNLDSGEEIDPGKFEVVWAGTGLFERHILPKGEAEVDAFLIVRGEDIIRFHHRPSTSSQYGIRPLGKGNYLLTYLIVSENFEHVTKTFKLEFEGDYTQINFFEWSEVIS